MEKLSQEYIMTTSFRIAVDMEELFIRKCNDYYEDIKSEELKVILDGFKNMSQEHIKMMKDKMVKLNVVY